MKPANYAPVYAAALYPQWAEIAREHGYALAVHGSLARDFDLIAVPWRDDPLPSEPQAVVDAITTKFAAKETGGPPSQKPHGRRTYTLSIGFGECFADLSFLPRFVGVANLVAIVEDSAAKTLLPTASTATAEHHPEEWGPSDARRLTCSCGNPDPNHIVGTEGAKNA